MYTHTQTDIMTKSKRGIGLPHLVFVLCPLAVTRACTIISDPTVRVSRNVHPVFV
jgi:hypothetical protein